MEQKSLVNISVQDEITIASLDAAAVSTSGVDPIARILHEMIEAQRPQKLILDLGKVRFISSMMLGLLVDIWRRMKDFGGRVRICGVDPQLMRVFRITHLDRIFDFSDDRTSAVEEMKIKNS